MVRHGIHLYVAMCGLHLMSCLCVLGQEVPEIAVLRPDVDSRVSNGGWKYDRYQDLPSLDAHSRMTVADLEGPGVIRTLHIRTTGQLTGTISRASRVG